MKCPYGKCKGTGFILQVNQYNEEEFVPCQCRNEKIKHDSIKRKLIEARIPVRYWDYNFENYLALPFAVGAKDFNKPALEVYKGFYSDPDSLLTSKQVLWIWGDEENSCHTTLATILGTELLKKNHKVSFIEFYKLLEVFTDFENKQDNLKALQNADVIIIDDAFDMGRCSISNYKQGQLFGFLNDALNNNKHLICTSNIPILKIDNMFSQLKIILSRSYQTLEFKGSITRMLERQK